MNANYFEVKDHCREGLLKYLKRACSIITTVDHPKILDAGYGSGVPTLFILERFGGIITATDPEPNPLGVLKDKVKTQKLSDSISTIEKSLFDLNRKSQFDLVFAEGLLNVIGFQKGFNKLAELTRKEGLIIIHDEFANKKEKLELMVNSGCIVLDSFEINEKAWWDDYYSCLEREISAISNQELRSFFKTDEVEIKMYKEDPSQFKSIYYVLQKN